MRRLSLSAFATASNLFSLFKISLQNYFKTKFYIYLKLHVQPTEIEQMDYYEFHYLVKDLTDHLKQEKEAHDKQNEQVNQGSSRYKQPNMPKMSVPKFNTPKLK